LLLLEEVQHNLSQVSTPIGGRRIPERALENAADQQPARAAAQGSAQEDQGGRAVPERGERATPGDGTPAAHPRELAGAALPRYAAALRAGAARRGSGSRRLSRPATPTPDSFTQKRLRHQRGPARRRCLCIASLCRG